MNTLEWIGIAIGSVWGFCALCLLILAFLSKWANDREIDRLISEAEAELAAWRAQ
jgi:hypothetical protein